MDAAPTRRRRKELDNMNKLGNHKTASADKCRQADTSVDERLGAKSRMKRKNSQNVRVKSRAEIRKTESQDWGLKTGSVQPEPASVVTGSTREHRQDLMPDINSSTSRGAYKQNSRKTKGKTLKMKRPSNADGHNQNMPVKKLRVPEIEVRPSESHEQQTGSPNKKGKTGTKNQSFKQKRTKTMAAPQLDVSDPLALLMMMEGHGGNRTGVLGVPSASASGTKDSESDEEEKAEEEQSSAATTDAESEGISDWEEVHDHHVADRSHIPDGSVEITLEMPDILRGKSRQKKVFDWKAHLERRVKRFKREVAAEMHKVHLLCLLALGMQQNDALNDLTVKAVMLSLLPAEFLTRKKLGEQRQVENLLLWFKRKFSLENVTHCSSTRLITASSLTDAVSHGSITDARVWILVFISVLRIVGLTIRLVLSFQPVRFKAHQGWDEKKGGRQGKKKKRPAEESSVQGGLSVKTSSTKPQKTNTVSKKAQKPKRRPSRRESSKKATEKNKSALKKYDDDDEDYADEDERVSDVYDSDSDFSERSAKKMKEQRKKTKAATLNGSDSSSSEMEFEESRSSFVSGENILKDLKILSNRKVLSPSTSDDEAAGGKRHGPLGHDIWLEVYIPGTKRWVCFDCFKAQFGKPHSLENSATQPLMYVLGYKNDGSVKDVTARYAKQWLSHTRKSRIDQEWWIQTLFLFDKTPYKENLLEDDEIKGQLLVRPMPTSIGEFKNHPLYALRRHLLKFEAIYPETAVPLGYVRKEPVYARECVRTLHSRDNWLKEGRLVRLNETPYKMVKSRPKWNKPKENPDDLDLELFGEWQTEVYIPPPAVNGKVPRNVYGNVDLFKPWMLPKGTVQVRGHGLQKVAKKLNIDVAPAMIGWDYHSGFSHPTMDGWVVCEEFADTLMAAWEEDQEIQRQREMEKKEKRVYDNWRRLIRGLLIKERLKVKFLQQAPQTTEKTEKETFSDGEEACDAHLSWPRNRQEKVLEERSQAVNTERHREFVGKPLVHTLKSEVIKNSSGFIAEADRGKRKILGGQKDLSLSEKKRKVPILKKKRKVPVSSDGSDSDDEVVEARVLKLKQRNKRCSKEDGDSDFVVCETKKISSKRGKTAAVVTDDDDVELALLPKSDSIKRTSLARQAKSIVKYVSDMEVSDCEIEQVSMGAVNDEENVNMIDRDEKRESCRKKNAVTRQTVKSLRHEEEEVSHFEDDQIKFRKKHLNKIVNSGIKKCQLETSIVENDDVTEVSEDKSMGEGRKVQRCRRRVRVSK